MLFVGLRAFLHFVQGIHKVPVLLQTIIAPKTYDMQKWGFLQNAILGPAFGSDDFQHAVVKGL